MVLHGLHGFARFTTVYHGLPRYVALVCNCVCGLPILSQFGTLQKILLHRRVVVLLRKKLSKSGILLPRSDYEEGCRG